MPFGVGGAFFSPSGHPAFIARIKFLLLGGYTSLTEWGQAQITTPIISSFLSGDRARAESIGITFDRSDKVAAGLAMAVIAAKTAYYNLGLRIPFVSARVDRQLNARLARLLDTYGHADFVTDPDHYDLAVG